MESNSDREPAAFGLLTWVSCFICSGCNGAKNGVIVMQFQSTYCVILNFYISGSAGNAFNHSHVDYGTVIWLLAVSKLPKFDKPSLRTTS